MSSAVWVVVIIFILNYIFACLAMIIFKKNDPFHFGNLEVAFFSMWRVEVRPE